MTKRGVYTAASIVLITIISIALVVIDRPELSFVVSDDGVVKVEGEWRADQPVTITMLDDGRYELAPDVLTISDPVRVTFTIDDTRQVYRWNTNFNMWDRVPLMIDSGQLGVFWISDPIDVDAPDFVSQYDQLLMMAPEGTVAYRIAVGVVTQDGDIMRLDERGQTGGCAGILGRGNVTEYSQREHDVRVFVNDVETLVRFLFVAHWTVDELGCNDEESLRSVLY